MYRIPSLLYADDQGSIFNDTSYKMAVSSGGYDFVPYEKELILMPASGDLVPIPNSSIRVYDEEISNMLEFEQGVGVAARLSKNYIRSFLPSIKTTNEGYHNLPYVPVGWLEGEVVTAAVKIDEDVDVLKLHNKMSDMKEELQDNRILKFMTSPEINNYPRYDGTNCVIPVSLGAKSSKKGAANIIKEDELVEYAALFCKSIKKPVVSFVPYGGVCPLSVIKNLSNAIDRIKEQIPNVSINVNADFNKRDDLRTLLEAPIDSISVNTISLEQKTYDRYNSANHNAFYNMLKGIETAMYNNVCLSLNISVFPGLTDRENETKSIIDFIKAFDVKYIRLTNLCQNPESVYSMYDIKGHEVYGILNMFKNIRKEHKEVQFGAYERHKSNFNKKSKFPKLKYTKI